METKTSFLDFLPVFDVLNEAIVIFDKEKYLWVNEAYATLRGYDSPDEIIGTSIFNGIHPDEAQENVRVLAERARTRKSTKGIWRVRKKDESYQPVVAHSSLLPDPENVITIAIIRPVDDEKRDIMPVISMAGITHEINSALTVVKGYHELLRDQDGTQLNSEQEKWFDVIDQNIKRIEDVSQKISYDKETL
jgi:two-component system, sporulation sensor kinase A